MMGINMLRRVHLSPRTIALAAALPLGLVVAYSALASSPDTAGQRAIRVTPAQAISTLRHLVPTGSLRVSAPKLGSLHYYYEVDGAGIQASVDAYTGSLGGLIVIGRMPSTRAVAISPAAAQSAAKAYLVANAIPAEGLTPAVQLVDHGSFQEYDVTWQHRINGALVPDQRLLSVNPETGDVFSFVNISYPYAPPARPVVSEEQAIAAADSLLGVTASSTIVSSDLIVTFDSQGRQILVWRVGVRENGSIPTAAMVQVDAMTGAATVIGRG
jgi:Peptidase propeptide and YPEB domain